MMYGSTACLSLCYKKIQKYRELTDENILLIDACLEITLAVNLLQAHYQVKDSIFWKTSSRATKKRVNEKLNHLAFDAYAGLLKAGELLDGYVNKQPNGLPQHLQAWQEIIGLISHAAMIMENDHRKDIKSKQLSFPFYQNNTGA